jgi:predicted negative regulator of RcsB-dependent stress response
MPKIIKKRSDKDEERDEDLRDTIGDIRERMKVKQKTLVYSLILFLVVASVVVAVVVYSRVTASRALDLAAEGYTVYHGDYTASPLPPAERYKKALALFKESYDKKKRAPVLLYIAYSQYELGDYDGSIKSLKELIDTFTDPQIVPLAYLKMASAYVKKNDPESALAALRSLASIKSSPLQDLALLEIGKILESRGKADEAKSAYRDLVTKFPKSALVNEAKAKLGEKQEPS